MQLQLWLQQQLRLQRRLLLTIRRTYKSKRSRTPRPQGAGSSPLFPLTPFDPDGRHDRIDNGNDDGQDKRREHPYPSGSDVDSLYQEEKPDEHKRSPRLAVIRPFALLIFVHLFALLRGGPEVCVVKEISLFQKLKRADNKRADK